MILFDSLVECPNQSIQSVSGLIFKLRHEVIKDTLCHLRIFILQDFCHALSGPLVEMLLPEVKLLRSIGHFSLKPLIELLLPVKIDLHAIEFEDQSMRVAPPDQTERVASCRFKIYADAQRSTLDPSSVLG